MVRRVVQHSVTKISPCDALQAFRTIVVDLDVPTAGTKFLHLVIVHQPLVIRDVLLWCVLRVAGLSQEGGTEVTIGTKPGQVHGFLPDRVSLHETCAVHEPS